MAADREMMPRLRAFAHAWLMIAAFGCSQFEQPQGNKAMAWIPAGKFWMGCAGCGMPDAEPVHEVAIHGFWMDRTPVTNNEFAQFVAATGYVTVAERAISAADLPQIPPESFKPGSAVFLSTDVRGDLSDPLRWWRYVAGANWRHPAGPGSNLEGRGSHPVVHVAFEDAEAYARWAAKRLPTEAEFEYAARGGLDRKLYAWGDELDPGGRFVANLWQGAFPERDEGLDGYAGTSPVMAFPPNGYGLYDMGGNVWQWCSDWYRADYYRYLVASNSGIAHDPKGPPASLDPAEPLAAKRVVRGGSYLCSEEYCAGYLVGSRGKAEVKSPAQNVGFRLAR